MLGRNIFACSGFTKAMTLVRKSEGAYIILIAIICVVAA